MKRLFSLAILTVFILAVDTVSAAESHQSNWKYREQDPAKKICFALYTLHNNTLKMTAQFYPLAAGEGRTTQLQAKEGGKWQTVARARVSERPYGHGSDRL